MSPALRSLSNSDLLKSTKQVVARERGITIEVLDHLNEVEWRKLYLTLGHSSMFAYCTAELGYSTSAAKRRISAARCVARFPEALPLLKANEINLSTITQVSNLLKPHNSHEVLQRICGKTQREVDAIIAEYEPLEALPRDRARTVVVRVPVKANPTLTQPRETQMVSAQSASAPVPVVQDCGGHEPEVLTSLAPAVQLERRVVKQFCAREVVMNKVETVRALASHRLPMNAPFEEVIEFLADYFLQREDPKVRHARREAGEQKPKSAPESVQKPESTPNTSSARAIPVRVRDEVFVRDQGACSYVGPDGKRCGSKHVVQIDHVQPVARNGSASVGNLRLLCAYHNRMMAEKLMGKAARRWQDRNGPELDM